MTLDDILQDLRRQSSDPKHAETGIWVAAVLRDRIAAGQLAPGAKLSEQALSEVLSVSRNTLREAFSTLASEHVVVRIPNRGVYVARPSADDIREMYRVRRFLEPAALLWSPAGDTAPLHAAVARAREAREAGSVSEMADANQKFHAALVALTGSERLVLQMTQVLAEMRLVFHSMVADGGFHAPYIERNARMLDLLDAGFRTEAAELMTEYLHRAESQLLAAVAHPCT
ncbi:GntR family transcriptional regulator [Cryobacterium roopkundense]|uniref:GntR family transcriptional regulator n=1 Tax=Cryobacterium roopkundense TaxID=1001240 RepID=A0A099JQG1_9MICO|nr:GntR family transcriptional regulator [Cryobacterium roopkundense]KGJ79643.1 GntR family transcriptional regulator [Cryobacterium roopkundense]MBB5639772.1 DNA-binding GntR family transcriptional regulator [Cryobacterium roopkundense]